jgi:hypothetical protein
MCFTHCVDVGDAVDVSELTAASWDSVILLTFRMHFLCPWMLNWFLKNCGVLGACSIFVPGWSPYCSNSVIDSPKLPQVLVKDSNTYFRNVCNICPHTYTHGGITEELNNNNNHRENLKLAVSYGDSCETRLKWRETGWDGIDWINLAHERD